MLIEFSVANFRSFRERQTLSMVAAPRLHKRENIFRLHLQGEKKLELLKVAVVYGPNASGKSNFLKALNAVTKIAGREASTQAALLPVSSFCFDHALAIQPSEFELHFIHKGMRYQFELSATPENIVTERLTAYPKGREALMYQREHRDGADRYEFGSLLDSSKPLHETWIRITPPRVLFITQAIANSNDRGGPLESPYEWLTGSILSVLNGMGNMVSGARNLLRTNPSFSDQISSFLCDVDVPVSRIRVETETTPSALSQIKSDSPEVGGGLIHANSPNTKVRNRTTLTHTSALGDADLDFSDESEGTKNLVGFWLPWTTKDPSDISERCILVVDELDGSLHPKIVAALVSKHLQSEIPSQLIFTTHDTHLMDTKLLRRDQFWITERDINGATQLRCIYDFEGREGEDIEKRYYEGRYRGLPFVKRS